MFDFLASLLKHFLPDEDDTWADRTAKIAIIVVLVGLAYLMIRNTELGNRIGINPLPEKEILPRTLTHVEIKRRQLEQFQKLAWIREQNRDITGAFIVGLIDKRTDNLLTEPRYDQYTKALLMAHSTPIGFWDNLDVVQSGFNGFLIPVIKEMEKAPDSLHCVGGKMPPELIAYFQKGIADFQSTHAVACPLYGTKKDGGQYIIAATLAIYKPNDGKGNPRIEAMLRQITSDLGDRMSLTKEYRYYHY